MQVVTYIPEHNYDNDLVVFYYRKSGVVFTLRICNVSQSSNYVNIHNIYGTGIRKWKSVLNVYRKEML